MCISYFRFLKYKVTLFAKNVGLNSIRKPKIKKPGQYQLLT